jgi:hypothetical protein
MTVKQADLSSGLPASREETVRACPDVSGWTENLLFTPYDAVNDIGMWLHLGTVADMWEMWEDRVLIALPKDEGVLSMWAYHRTAPDRQPAGSNLAFRCERPFAEWCITFDGFCVRSSYDAMRTGLLTDGPKSHVRLDLDVHGVTPVWDAESGPAIASGAGMAEQSWAREHYEQLTRVTGEVSIDGRSTRFDGGGWRDHSRGPRGADTLTDWGGHVIVGGVMPSGHAFGLCRYWARDGRTTLEGAYVVSNGALRHVQVDEVPSPAELSRDGERFTVAFDGGTALTGTIRSSLWLSMAGGLPYGVLEAARAYTVSWAEVTWGDETGHVYVERSNLSGGGPR